MPYDIQHRIEAPLCSSTYRVDIAVVQGGVLVAISPLPALNGLLAALRRVVWTSAGTSGADLLEQTAADGVLAHLPVISKIAAAVPGAGLAALRLCRLADVTARACSPLCGRAGLTDLATGARVFTGAAGGGTSILGEAPDPLDQGEPPAAPNRWSRKREIR